MSTTLVRSALIGLVAVLAAGVLSGCGSGSPTKFTPKLTAHPPGGAALPPPPGPGVVPVSGYSNQLPPPKAPPARCSRGCNGGTCVMCQGGATRTCNACYGSGRLQVGYSYTLNRVEMQTCNACRGAGRHPCVSCNGSGRCSTCDGSGLRGW